MSEERFGGRGELGYGNFERLIVEGDEVDEKDDLTDEDWKVGRTVDRVVTKSLNLYNDGQRPIVLPSRTPRARAAIEGKRALRSTVVACALVAIPIVIAFINAGVYTLPALTATAGALTVAVLFVVFDALQKYQEAQKDDAGQEDEDRVE